MFYTKLTLKIITKSLEASKLTRKIKFWLKQNHKHLDRATVKTVSTVKGADVVRFVAKIKKLVDNAARMYIELNRSEVAR